jgi:hypothetical protein
MRRFTMILCGKACLILKVREHVDELPGAAPAAEGISDC